MIINFVAENNVRCGRIIGTLGRIRGEVLRITEDNHQTKKHIWLWPSAAA